MKSVTFEIRPTPYYLLAAENMIMPVTVLFSHIAQQAEHQNKYERNCESKWNQSANHYLGSAEHCHQEDVERSYLCQDQREPSLAPPRYD